MPITLVYYDADAAINAFPYFDSSVVLNKELDNKYIITAYHKKVVSIQTIEEHGFIDTYAHVYDERTGSFRKIKVLSTRYKCSGNDIKIDATDDLFDKFAFITTYEQEQFKAISNAKEFNVIRKNNKVVVSRGSKNKGVVGIVFWQGVDSYGTRKLGISPSGIKVDGKYTDSVWIAESYCDLVKEE